MSELEKLDAGKPYYFLDDEVAARKANAAKLCQEFNEIPATQPEKQTEKIKQIFGKTGERVSVQATFNCDNGKNISVGEDFLSNYNLTILDIAPVKMGHNVMIGPNVDIYTVNHPLDAKARRHYMLKASRLQSATTSGSVVRSQLCQGSPSAATLSLPPVQSLPRTSLIIR